MGRRISRTQIYAMQENQQQLLPSISCTTFNILAPIFKRLNQEEFWVGNEELVNLYEKRLGDAGLLIAVQKEYFKVVNYKELHFNDCGDRVAQLLHVELAFPLSQCQNSGIKQEILIVNTHLLFPHDSSLCLVRLHQVYKILQYVESYQNEYQLKPLPIILCGTQGFVSSYDTAHHYTDADAHKWISHRNHLGNTCAVDFIWLLNPDKYRKLVKASWSEAVFDMFKCLLRRASPTDSDAFSFLKADNEDCVTYFGFCKALQQLNLIGQCYGLSAEETKELWFQADIDGNGVIDYKQFLHHLWNPTGSDQRDENNNDKQDDVPNDSVEEETIGFSVKNAVMFPSEVEKGRWPEDYSLSDHARLTVVFSPIRIPCSNKIS
ncbi:hypothetical protein TSUD_216740 [Trifolium subterraneum]|uniref:EF-hand domain-containing protein n=1 Tax=Trifolium subterraneum TaxID=3900 RepID=A0A2Z6M6F5_TRISU|nr:hypothetical protein TSUD_216740 [Trifolium subterraneum]